MTTNTGPVTSVSAESASLGPDTEGAEGQTGAGLESTVGPIDERAVSTTAPDTTETPSDPAAALGGKAPAGHGTVTNQLVRFVFSFGKVSGLY